MSKLVKQDDIKPPKLKGGKKKISKANNNEPPRVESSEADKKYKTLSANPKKALDTFGTNNIDIINVTLNEIVNVLPVNINNPNSYINAALATANELKPRDSYERMLVTQIIASHTMVMEFSRRAMLGDQSTEGVDSNVNRLTKLMRAFSMHTDALMKYRGKGQQTIKVQHINVQDNAQAIIGDVGGDK